MKYTLALFFFCSAFASTKEKNNNADLSRVVDGLPTSQAFIFEECGDDFPIHQNPGFNLRSSFAVNQVAYGIRFSEDFEFTPAAFRELKEKFFKSVPTEEFSSSVYLKKNVATSVKEFKWTFGQVLHGSEVKIFGQLVVSYSDIEDGYPLISSISIKSSTETKQVDKNAILQLFNEGKKQREDMASMPPPPPINTETYTKYENDWKTFPIGKTDMEMSFPAEPKQEAGEPVKNVEQYTTRIYTKDTYRFNFVYFISVLKFNTMHNVDSVTFINAFTAKLNNLKNKYTFKRIKEGEQNFKNLIARSTKANILTGNNDKFKYDGLSFKRKNYVVFMFVLTDPNYVDVDGRIPRFFNSLVWSN